MALAPYAGVPNGLGENKNSIKSVDRWAGPRCAVGAAAALVIGTRILFPESPEARAVAQIGGIGSIEGLRLIPSLLRRVRTRGPQARPVGRRRFDLFKDSFKNSRVSRGLAALGVWTSQMGGWMECTSTPVWGLATLGGWALYRAFTGAGPRKPGQRFGVVLYPIDDRLAALGLSLTLIALGISVDPEGAVHGSFPSPDQFMWWLRGLTLNVGLILTFREQTPLHESVGLGLIGFSGFFKISMLSSVQMGLNDGFLFLWAYWFVESLQKNQGRERLTPASGPDASEPIFNHPNSGLEKDLNQDSADKPTKS